MKVRVQRLKVVWLTSRKSPVAAAAPPPKRDNTQDDGRLGAGTVYLKQRGGGKWV